MIIPWYEDKGKRTKCKNYMGIGLLSVAGKICEGVLVDRVLRVLDEEQGCFRTWEGVYRTDLRSETIR